MKLITAACIIAAVGAAAIPDTGDTVFHFPGKIHPVCKIVGGRTIVHYDKTLCQPSVGGQAYQCSWKCKPNEAGDACKCNTHQTHHRGGCMQFVHTDNTVHRVSGDCADSGKNLPKCLNDDHHTTYNGYMYRTLYKASRTSPGLGQRYNTQEQAYKSMPDGYEVAPDDSDIVTNVIANNYWDVWRLCTDTKCFRGKHYPVAERGTVDPPYRNWEKSGAEYRIKPGNPWFRLLLRTECAA